MTRSTPWRTRIGRLGTGALGAVGLLSLLGASCMPARSTPPRPIASVVRAGGRPVLCRLAVATLPPDTRAVPPGGRGGRLAASLPGHRDKSLPELVAAVRRAGLAQTVLQSPVNDVSHREVLLAAKSAGATHLVSTRVLALQLRQGYNAHFAWSLTLGIALFPLLPLFYYLAPQQTLQGSATLEVALWNVAEGRRVWNHRAVGDATLTSALTTRQRNLHRVSRVALNVAYRRALPVLLRQLRRRIKPPATGLSCR